MVLGRVNKTGRSPEIELIARFRLDHSPLLPAPPARTASSKRGASDVFDAGSFYVQPDGNRRLHYDNTEAGLQNLFLRFEEKLWVGLSCLTA